jgi:hypothetical protein
VSNARRGRARSPSTWPAPRRPATGVTLYFETDHLEAEFERLRRAGIEFDQEPTDMPWRWREARLRYPDGPPLCLFHGGDNRLNPPWRLSS